MSWALRQAGAMRKLAAGVLVVLGLAACGGEAADSVAVPGAPPGGDTRPPISAVRPASTTTTATTTTDVARSTTTRAPTVPTTLAKTTTTPVPVTPVPVTTVPALAPTTTALVYSPEPADGPLTVGVEGPRSLQVQQQLIALAILPSTAADSKYGPGTASGVRRFQEFKGLVVDGVAGPKTIAALAAAVGALTPPTTTG